LDAIERRIREDFARQDFMKTVGAEIVRFAPGCVEVQVDVHPALLQQDGSVDAGVLSAMADISAGYAAMSLLDPRAEGLTAEFKINFVAPARADSRRQVAGRVRSRRLLGLRCRRDVRSHVPRDLRLQVAVACRTRWR
jgi:uncharacterized protein (TIGR00369 family)